MLSRIIKRNVFITTNFRCTSALNNGKAADDGTKPQTNKINELLENLIQFHNVKPEWKWATRPYMQSNDFKKPEERSVVLFPGQGSQYVGMAKNLTKYPKAMDLFGLASEILKCVLMKTIP